MKNLEEITKLSNHQQVRIKGFKHTNKLEVFIYENDQSFILRHSTALVGDYDGRDKELSEARNAYLNAPLIEDGQKVLIDGKLYSVRVIGEQYSDVAYLNPVEVQK